MKTSELTSSALDWAVARCEGYPTKVSRTGFLIFSDPLIQCGPMGSRYSPSTNWSQGGPIIEREGIRLDPPRSISLWSAEKDGHLLHGLTPLIAAMRCYVASKLGGEIEVPEELA